MGKGRPSEYSEEKALRICEGITEGRSIRSICDEEGMPASGTVYRWLSEHEDFQRQYTRARENRAHARFERIDEVLAALRAREIDPQTARVEIDAIKWQCGKEHGKYNDKHEIQHSGHIESERGLSTLELAHRVSGLLAAAGAGEDRGAGDGDGSDLDAAPGSADGGAED